MLFVYLFIFHDFSFPRAGPWIHSSVEGKYLSCRLANVCYCIPNTQHVEQDQSEIICKQSFRSGPSQVSRNI